MSRKPSDVDVDIEIVKARIQKLQKQLTILENEKRTVVLLSRPIPCGRVGSCRKCGMRFSPAKLQPTSNFINAKFPDKCMVCRSRVDGGAAFTV